MDRVEAQSVCLFCVGCYPEKKFGWHKVILREATRLHILTREAKCGGEIQERYEFKSTELSCGNILLVKQAVYMNVILMLDYFFIQKDSRNAVLHAKYFYSKFAYLCSFSYTVLVCDQTGFMKCISSSKKMPLNLSVSSHSAFNSV